MSRLTKHLILMVLLSFGPSLLFAGLRVFPTRILLTDREKTSKVALRHTGKYPTKYRLKTIFYRMGKDGTLKRIANPLASERPAMKYIRFSPRQVTLQPNVEQIIRIMVRRTGKLTPGDYRAHLFFEQIEEIKPRPRTASQGDKPEVMSMQLKARLAVAIPIIFRHGKTDIKVSLSGLKIIKDPKKAPAFEVNMTQTGNQFAHGAFKAYFTPKGKKKAKQVGLVRGISSYVPSRKMSFPLSVPAGVKLENGTLRLEFVRPANEGGTLLAEAQVAVK